MSVRSRTPGRAPDRPPEAPRRTPPWLLLAGGDLAYKALMAMYWVAASRTLPKADVGSLALGTAIGVPVFLIIDAGFNQLLVREYRYCPDGHGLPRSLQGAYQGRMRAAVAGMVVVGVASIALADGPGAILAVGFIAGCYWADLLTQMWLAPARARLDMVPDAAVRAIQGGVPLVALLALHAAGALTPVTAAVTSVAAYLAAGALAYRQWRSGGQFSQPDLEALAPGSGHEFNAAFVVRTAYTRADAILVQALAGPVALANYTAAAKLVEAARVVPGSIGKAVLAGLSASSSDGPASGRLPTQVSTSLVTSALAAGALAVAGPWAVGVMFGVSYADGADSAIRVLAASLLVTGFTVPTVGVFLATKRSAVVVRGAVFALLATIGSGIPLTLTFGITGTAVAVVVGESLGAGVFAWALRRSGERPAGDRWVAGVSLAYLAACVALVAIVPPLSSVSPVGAFAAGGAAVIALWLRLSVSRPSVRPDTAAG
jgi:O-antigen/teichoic acid export membrane protein